jgi:hypothetical protein
VQLDLNSCRGIGAKLASRFIPAVCKAGINASVPGTLAKSNLAHGSRTVMLERSLFSYQVRPRGVISVAL